jgi:hypothetical protein
VCCSHVLHRQRLTYCRVRPDYSRSMQRQMPGFGQCQQMKLFGGRVFARLSVSAVSAWVAANRRPQTPLGGVTTLSRHWRLPHDTYTTLRYKYRHPLPQVAADSICCFCHYETVNPTQKRPAACTASAPPPRPVAFTVSASQEPSDCRSTCRDFLAPFDKT